jgi:hypothetical protein
LGTVSNRTIINYTLRADPTLHSPDYSYEEEHNDSHDKDSDSFASETLTEGSSVQAVGKKSWVESCIEAATLATDPTFSLPPLCTTEIQKRGRRDQNALDEQPLRKRRWAEAMEAAGNEHRPPQSNWVEAMARTAEPILATKQNKKQEHNVHGELLKSLVELSSSFVQIKKIVDRFTKLKPNRASEKLVGTYNMSVLSHIYFCGLK